MMTKNFASQNNLVLKRIVYTYLLLLDKARIFLRLNHIWLLFFLWHTLPNSIYHSVQLYYSVLYHYFSTHRVLVLVEFRTREVCIRQGLGALTCKRNCRNNIACNNQIVDDLNNFTKKKWIGKIALIFWSVIWIIFD